MSRRVENEFLPFVRRPSRYIGGEINQIKKDLDACELRIALCFPDVYEVGMSNQGIAILYDLLNSMESVAAERVFSPWTDAADILRSKELPLFTLESKGCVRDFDVLGFSLTNELCYTNMLEALDLAGIPLNSTERGPNDPLVVAGGTMANCCEPVADFVDLFVIGEGEQAAAELAELTLDSKRSRVSKADMLLQAAKQFDWAYVPALYDINEQGGLVPRIEGLRTRFENAVVEDFENAPVPLKPIVPFTQAVHERVSVEIMRGCPGRCRFCQASFCRRPIRYRSVDKIVETAKACYASTGFDTVSLLSLSSAEYPDLEELAVRLNDYFQDKHVGISLPSLRVDQQLKLLPRMLTSVRKGGLTIAVEAATEKLRRIINKPISDDDLLAAAKAAYAAGWQRMKLYFMVGLPGETEEDVRSIVELSLKLAKIRREVDGKTGQLNVAVSWFVPKPHTPFGMLGQRPMTYFERAKQLILDEKKRLKAKMCTFKFHHIQRSVLESAIGRSGRELAAVIEQAWKSGARFDLWNECFDYDLWVRAFGQAGIDLHAVAERQFPEDRTLPWDHLGGPSKSSLLRHLFQSHELMAKDE